MTSDLEGGNRQKAMKRLRVPPLGEKVCRLTTCFFYLPTSKTLGKYTVKPVLQCMSPSKGTIKYGCIRQVVT